MSGEVLDWPTLLQRCSRLHTTHRRPEGPWDGAELREDSQSLDVTVCGEAATIVPTRMHEPGFYVRFSDGIPIWRGPRELRILESLTGAGLVASTEVKP